MAEVAEQNPAAVATNVAAAGLAVKTVELRKRFGRTIALAGLSMSVPRGEVFGFLGPNGAGKTTAVKLLLGLLSPTSGEGWLLGRPLGDLGARRRIGYLPELFRYQAWLTAAEVLALHCELAPLPRSSWKDEIRTVLDTVGLTERADDRVGTFSKGMQQRLGLGVALLGEPALVILDEPTSALDPVGRHQVRLIIRDLRERGTAVFLNTHLLAEAEQVCDRVTVISKGRALATGPPDELRRARPVVRFRVSGLQPGWWQPLANGARWKDEGDWLLAEELDPERIPDVVAGAVALGGRVEAVVPEQQSLEASFLELLGER
jgi:ABC-2 type transport system ATP-binding protein